MKKMKFFKGITLLVIALAAVLGSCVDNDFDTPAAREIPVGDVVTIAQLKTFFTDSGAVNINSAVGVAYEFKRDISVYATVTMDDKTGNLYEMAYIQDPTGGIALKFDVAGGIQEGDTIRLNVKGLIINQYAKAFQINAIHGEGFKKENYITTIDVNKFRTPEIATISQITTNKSYYQGRLVKIENTQFVAGDTMQTYADYANFISRNLNIEQAGGATLIVRTSGYASFADEKSPKGSGSIIGVMGQYNNDMQLQIRKTSEVIMTADRLGSGGGAGTGTGTIDDPYDVTAAMARQNDQVAWVEGYIVGGIIYDPLTPGGTDYITTTIDGPEDVVFGTNVRNTAVLLADSKTETDYTKCIAVNLPSGSVRSAVNLKDHPENLGKQLKVEGKLRAYFNIPGVRDLTGNYNLEGQPSGGDAIFSETFATGQGSFTIENVTMNAPLSYVWIHDATYKYMKASAYVSGANYPSESWLISPAVDLTGKTGLTFEFEHAIGPASQLGIDKAHFTVWVSSNYTTGNPNSATWVQITVTEFSTTAWTIVPISKSIPVEFENTPNVRFAFKYTSTASASATWEVKNIVVK